MGRVSPSKQNTYGQRPVVPEIPKVQIPTGGRSAIKRAEREAAVKRSQTPFVPPAPTSSSSTRQGGRARVTGGIQIGVPQSSPISTQRPNRSSNTTTETPTQNPTRPVQATGGVSIPALPSDYKETEQAAGQTAENHRAGAGFGGQTRVSPTGVVQKGTQTSPRSMSFDDANSVLAKYGITNNGFGEKFSSNQLPSTKSSPYGESSGADNQVMGGSARDSAVIESGGSVETVIGGDTDLDSVKSTYSSGDNSARRRAFLDYSGPGGAMGALRAAEASDGVMYAGGKHHIANPNAGKEGQNDFMAINKDEARQIQYGTQTAQGLKDQYVNALTSKGDYSEYQSKSPAPLPGAVPGDSPVDKSMFDTQDFMEQKPGKSIIGDNTPYKLARPGTLFR